MDQLVEYYRQNAPLPGKELCAEEVANTATFLLSPLASAITGTTVYVDHGLHSMAIGYPVGFKPDQTKET